MAPSSTAATEGQLLQSYLLNPASLPTIITLEEFRALFPAKYRSHPQVKLLYRDLQFLRTVDTDLVDDHIVQECRNGERQRREMHRALYAGPHLSQQGGGGAGGGQAEGDKDVQMDEVFYGQTGSVPKRKKNHTTESLLGAMEETIRYLEVDCQVVGRDANQLLEQMRQTVGSLGDLKTTPSTRISSAEAGAVVRDLKRLEDAVNSSLIQP